MKRKTTAITSLFLILILLLINVLTTSAQSNTEISTDNTLATSNTIDVASLDHLLVSVTGLKKGDTATVTLLPEPALVDSESFIKRTLISEGTENIVTDVSYPLMDGYYQLQLSAPDEYFREPKAWLFMVSNSQLVNPLGKSAVFKLLPPENQQFKPYRGSAVQSPVDLNTAPPAPPSEPPSIMMESMLSLSAPAKLPISKTSSPSGLSTWLAQPVSASSPGPWMEGWGYRKQITISGSSAGAQTNYQMKLNVNKGSGTDSSNSVYLNNHSLDDFADVRFTKWDGTTTTLLDHWRESYTSGSSAVFWVEFDSIPASPNTAMFYIYYGNIGVSSASNGANTFPFFDDFDGTSLDGSKWTSGGTVSVSGGQVTITGLESSSNIISTVSKLYGAAHWKGSATNNYYTYLMWGNNPATGRIEWNWQQSGRYFLTWDNSNYTQTSVSGGSPGVVYPWDIFWKSGWARGYRDNSLEATHTTTVPSSANQLALYAYKSGAAVDTVVLDYAFFSNWVDPEPTWSTWGAEEDKDLWHYFGWESRLESSGISARFTLSDPGVRHSGFNEFAVDHIYAAKYISGIQHWMEAGWAEVSWSYPDIQYVIEYDSVFKDWRFFNIDQTPVWVALKYFSAPYNEWYSMVFENDVWYTLASEDIGFTEATWMWNGGEVFTLYPDHPSFPSTTTDYAQLYLNGWTTWDLQRSFTTYVHHSPSNSPYDTHTTIPFYYFYIHYHQ